MASVKIASSGRRYDGLTITGNAGSQYIGKSYGIFEFNAKFEILQIKIHSGTNFIIQIKRFQ